MADSPSSVAKMRKGYPLRHNSLADGGYASAGFPPKADLPLA